MLDFAFPTPGDGHNFTRPLSESKFHFSEKPARTVHICTGIISLSTIKKQRVNNIHNVILGYKSRRMRLFLVKGPPSSQWCCRINVMSRQTATKEIKERVLLHLPTSTKMTASAVRAYTSASSCSLRVTLVPFSCIPKCSVKSRVRVLCAVLPCSVTTIAVVFRLLCERSALPVNSRRCIWNICAVNRRFKTMCDTKRSSSTCAGVWS